MVQGSDNHGGAVDRSGSAGRRVGADEGGDGLVGAFRRPDLEGDTTPVDGDGEGEEGAAAVLGLDERGQRCEVDARPERDAHPTAVQRHAADGAGERRRPLAQTTDDCGVVRERTGDGRRSGKERSRLGTTGAPVVAPAVGSRARK